MKEKLQNSRRRMGEPALAGESVTDATRTALERATIITTIRRMGFIAIKIHEVVMGRLTSQGEHELAERFNDCFKPVADMLVHFELDEAHSEEKGGSDGV